MNEDQNIPTVLSVSQMAQLLSLSRSRFYQLVAENILLPPIYTLDSKRPFYTEEMARRNLEVRRSNVGVNGQIIIFYAGRNKTQNPPPRKMTVKEKPSKQSPPGRHNDLIDALTGLGLENITGSLVEAALQECFPDRVEEVGPDEILRTIFRYLKRRNNEHKPRT